MLDMLVRAVYYDYGHVVSQFADLTATVVACVVVTALAKIHA